MRTAMRPRYYCDHCNKGNGSPSATALSASESRVQALQREVEELRALLIDARDTLCDLDTVYSESLRDRIDAATASKAEVPNV